MTAYSMALLWQNIRYALRTSVHSPGFVAVTAISLALGIGANTAIFSILDAVLFRQLPVPQPHQLMELSGIYRNGGRVPFSFPMFQALERWQRVFSGLYGWTGAAPSNLEAGGTLFLGGVRAVTGNYYSGLGATPLLGRLIAPGDLTGNPHVAVLGYECWEGRFGRDPAVIGKTLRIEGKPFTIVGVTRQWFMGMTPGEPPDITIPIVAAPFDPQSRALLTTFVTGRLRTGATIEQVRAQLASFWPELLLATVPTQSRGPRRQSFLSMRLAVEPAAAGANTGLRGQGVFPRHSAPQLVPPDPGGLVAGEREQTLQFQGAAAPPGPGDALDGPKPEPQWLAGPFEDRARRRRRLPVAGAALETCALQTPALPAAAMRAAKAVRPAQLDQVIAAGGLGREAGCQLGRGVAIVRHPASMLADCAPPSQVTVYRAASVRLPRRRRGAAAACGKRAEKTAHQLPR